MATFWMIDEPSPYAPREVWLQLADELAELDQTPEVIEVLKRAREILSRPPLELS